MTVDTDLEAQGAILHIRLSGKLTRDDYKKFVPVIDEHIEKVETVCLLIEMRDFHGWTAGALWSDISFGIQHFGKIDRLALVGENAWQKGMAMFCGPFTMARIRYFGAAKLEAARQWLEEKRGHPEKGQIYTPSNAPEPMAELLRTIGGEDGLERKQARAKLVKLGHQATEHLIAAAQGGHWQMRLEATQALAEIADPKAATALAGQFDDSLEIGWAAAEGLSKLGQVGAVATLEEIVKNPSSHGVRRSAHHALREMQTPIVREAVLPVVAALADSAPVDEAPVAAFAALEKLRE